MDIGQPSVEIGQKMANGQNIQLSSINTTSKIKMVLGLSVK